MIKSIPIILLAILLVSFSNAQTNVVCREGDTINVYTYSAPVSWYEVRAGCGSFKDQTSCPTPRCMWLVDMCVPEPESKSESARSFDLCTHINTSLECDDLADFGCVWSGSTCDLDQNQYEHAGFGSGVSRILPPDTRKFITLDDADNLNWFVSNELGDCPECVVEITAADSLCEDEDAITVLVDTTGGAWQGNGIKANGEFAPSDAGVGTHTISYVLSCGTAGTTDIVVSGIPNVELAEFNPNSVSESDGVQPLPAGTPSNGTYYDSTELVITDFDPSIYGGGKHTVYYVVLENGCQGLDTSSITVTVVTDVIAKKEAAPQFYPNPIVGNQLHVELGMPYTSLSGKVINQSGIEMVQFSNSNNKELILNTEAWIEGVYQIALDVDGTLVTFKVVK